MMNIKAITLVAALSRVAVLAAENLLVPTANTVAVCLEGSADVVSEKARLLASQMFAGIGLSIDWRKGLRECPQQGIMVTLGYGNPAGFRPEALAYARPYEGTYIRVFYDRISHTYNQPLAPIVLAHVLVHEITHRLARRSGPGRSPRK
jgi:hypothetical protein